MIRIQNFIGSKNSYHIIICIIENHVILISENFQKQLDFFCYRFDNIKFGFLYKQYKFFFCMMFQQLNGYLQLIYKFIINHEFKVAITDDHCAF